MKAISLAAAALLAAPLLSPQQAGAQVHRPIDCSYAVTSSGLRDCLRLQSMASQANRDFCINRINYARQLQAAGVRDAWLRVPSECLY